MSTSPNSPSPTQTDSPRGISSPKSRKWLFRLLSLFIVVGLFALIEFGLRVAGVAAPDERSDPYVGFSNVYPLFEATDDGTEMETSRPRRVFFGDQTFPIEKTPTEGKSEVFRAFVLGGSTVRGRPYETESAFSRWLELEIEGRIEDVDAQIINCGGLSYASYRLTPILDEVLTYKPDLIVIATGHNEYLEDRTYHTLKERTGWKAWIEEKAYSLRMVKAARNLGEQLAADDEEEDEESRTILASEVDARLDDMSGYASYHRDDEWRDQVAVHFDASIRAMVERCREAGVAVVLVQLGCNLRDTPPFKSELSGGLEAEQDQEWQLEFDAASSLKPSEAKAALEHYRKCEAIDDRHALLLFRMARCFDQLGEYDKSAEYYIRAREEDVCPLRKTNRLTETLTTIASDLDVPLVDVRTAIADRSPHGIPGFDAYIDHVHPTLGSHQLIGESIADSLREAEIIGLSADWPERIKTRNAHFIELGPAYLPNGNRRISWLEGWARRQKLYDETIPEDVRGLLHLGHRNLDLGQRQTAMESYMLAAVESQQAKTQLVAHSQDLVEQGRLDDAEYLLGQLLQFQPSPELLDQIWLGLYVTHFVREDLVAMRELGQVQQASLRSAVAQNAGWERFLTTEAIDTLRGE